MSERSDGDKIHAGVCNVAYRRFRYPARSFRLKPAADQCNAFVAETAHSDGIGSFVLTEETPMPWPVFTRTMDALMQLRGPDLLRVKGFLDVEGCKGPVLVQFVQHLAHPPVELQAWPDANRQSRVVFITRNIPERQVRALFQAIKALA